MKKVELTIMPYQGVKVGKAKYWDYNVKIAGVVYEISVNHAKGRMTIDTDENQGE